jgi:hypothetical protein
MTPVTSFHEQPVPQGISEYINDRFVDDYLTEIMPYADASGKLFWHVDVTHNNTIYHLRFNEQGVLVESVVEPVGYPGDDVEIGEGD